MKKLLLAGLLGGVLVAAPMAPAFAATTLVVDDDGAATATNCNAGAPGSAFSSIQEAVTAASPGDTIKVCPGQYTENVVVDKTLTINGPRANTAATRTLANEASVTGTVDGASSMSLQADGVVVNGFLFQNNPGPGLYTSPSNSGYQVKSNVMRNNVMGLYLHSAATGAQTVVQNNRFQTNNLAGSSNGNGIYTDQSLRNALIKNNRFMGNQNSGLLIGDADGIDNRNIIVTGNTSINDRTFFYVFQGFNIRVTNNTVQNSVADTALGSAIYIGDGSTAEAGTSGTTRGVVVSGNRITRANWSAIAVRGASDNVDLISNTIAGAGNDGIDVTTTANGAVTATSNIITNSGANGIFFNSETASNSVRSNRATGSGDKDCRDDSTGPNRAGVANYWELSNRGNTSSPAGLCRHT
ncbi:MAG: right-handed parallel beta-helix repeat-containing protein [Mycobacteriales bacterium]